MKRSGSVWFVLVGLAGCGDGGTNGELGTVFDLGADRAMLADLATLPNVAVQDLKPQQPTRVDVVTGDGGTDGNAAVNGPAVVFQAIAHFADQSTRDVSADSLTTWSVDNSVSSTNVSVAKGVAMPGDVTGYATITATYLGQTGTGHLLVQ